MWYIITMKNYKDLKNELLKNNEFKKEYELLEAEFDAIDQLITLRNDNNYTQKDLAEKMGTKQSSISRLERGMIHPTVEYLSRVAVAFGKKLVIHFK